MRYYLSVGLLFLSFAFSILTHAQPVPEIYIRGIRYLDHTANTRMTPTTVVGGGFFQIQSNTMLFSPVAGQPRHDLRVIIQDVNHPPNSSGGVTVFRLTNVRANGRVLTAQSPNYPILRNRSYHVTVFMVGPQPQHYAYAGVLRIN